MSRGAELKQWLCFCKLQDPLGSFFCLEKEGDRWALGFSPHLENQLRPWEGWARERRPSTGRLQPSFPPLPSPENVATSGMRDLQPRGAGKHLATAPETLGQVLINAGVERGQENEGKGV